MTTPQHRDTQILLIDCATSGFREATDTILEVAVALVDARTLQVLDVHNSVVRHAAGSVKAPDFHEALLNECAGPDAQSMAAVEGFLLAGPWTMADVVCNRALDFDLRFLAKHMKLLHAALVKNSKPHLELKALERIHLARGGAQYEPGPRTFRACDEVVEAYHELCLYASVLGARPTGGAQ
jgi:oligoribonuclease (3'-5' exoribonuclease)